MRCGCPDLSERELVGEIMDDPALDEREHIKALNGLRRINRVSRTAPVMFKALRIMLGQAQQGARVLDLACGDGDNTLRLAALAQRKGLGWRVEGCDISDRAVTQAQRAATARGLDAAFFQADALGDLPIERYDAVVNSLFLHHLRDDEIVKLLSKLRHTRHVVISDLVRSRRAYLTTCVGVRLFSTSRVVHIDGPLSVRAALTTEELKSLADQAGLAGARVVSRWPMRQLLTWSSGA